MCNMMNLIFKCPNPIKMQSRLLPAKLLIPAAASVLERNKRAQWPTSVPERKIKLSPEQEGKKLKIY